MAELTIKCPSCRKQKVAKYGFSFKRKQRYICRNNLCQKNIFIHLLLQDAGFQSIVKRLNLRQSNVGIRPSFKLD